jgi:hypothetical protein
MRRFLLGRIIRSSQVTNAIFAEQAHDAAEAAILLFSELSVASKADLGTFHAPIKEIFEI